ncbi:MAG: glycosyltransferase [Proteobacteria bacterium]|nr:glycosyltransferase [Pseudomonadota bacterium]
MPADTDVNPPRPGNDEGPFDATQDVAEPSLTVLVAVSTLHAGAADCGVIDLVRILTARGHRVIVMSGGGRMEPAVVAAGGEIVRRRLGSHNPATVACNIAAMARLARSRRCDVIHAHDRMAAWCAFVAARLSGVAFLTSWYKGFRQQNPFKRFYNGVLARGERVIVASDQLAGLICERHATPPGRIAVVAAGIDLRRFDPSAPMQERVAAIRREWGAAVSTKVILVVGRMLRRKGHHVVVQAIHRLRQRGLSDFACVFIGEDHGRTRYSGELWDLVMENSLADVVRITGSPADVPAAYAAAVVVVSGAIQPEGVQRALLEAMAMARPVVVSDLGAGPDIVQAPPLVALERMSGFRVPSGDVEALATALLRLLSMPEAEQNAAGARGREWVLTHFNDSAAVGQMLAVYREIGGRRAAKSARRDRLASS